MDVRRLVAALVLLGLLVSCSEDEPRAEPREPTSSATVSPSPTPTPEIPAEARGSDEASAKAFVRYWFEVFNAAVNSGDPRLLMRLSADACVSCTAFRKNIQKAYADGGRIQAVGWRPTSIDAIGGGRASRFALSVRQGDERYLDSTGDVVRHFPGGRRNMIIQLVRRDSAWLVEHLEIER